MIPRSANLPKFMMGFQPTHSVALASLWCCFSTSSSRDSSKEWLLPGFTAASPRQFRNACGEAGVAQIAFLRHGQTAPSANGVDFNRQLTDKGRYQSRQAGSSFGKSLLPLFPQVLASPAPRTMETAKLFLEAATGMLPPNDAIQLQPIPSLYDGTMQPEGSRLFRQIGYAPLREYVEAPDENDRAVARRVLGEYVTTVASEIYKQLTSTTSSTAAATAPPLPSSSSTLLVVGHAIYLPAAALGVATLCDCPSQYLNILMDTNTEEAQGYLVILNDQPMVRQLTRE